MALCGQEGAQRRGMATRWGGVCILPGRQHAHSLLGLSTHACTRLH